MEQKTHYVMLKEGKLNYICNNCGEDSDKITNDYHAVTCEDCKNILTEDILKIPVKKRTESMHLILVKYFGGVRQYLLTMGEFKDVEI